MARSLSRKRGGESQNPRRKKLFCSSSNSCIWGCTKRKLSSRRGRELYQCKPKKWDGCFGRSRFSKCCIRTICSCIWKTRTYPPTCFGHQKLQPILVALEFSTSKNPPRKKHHEKTAADSFDSFTTAADSFTTRADS